MNRIDGGEISIKVESAPEHSRRGAARLDLTVIATGPTLGQPQNFNTE